MKTYLYHLEKPLGQAQDDATRAARGLPPRKKDYTPHTQHYIGLTGDLDKRDNAHRSRKGSRLLAVAQDRGIDFHVVRTWDGNREKELKRRKDARQLCPICNPEHWSNNARDER